MSRPSIDTSAPCRLCYGLPALNVAFEGHITFALTSENFYEPGPLCRSCGVAAFRRLTAITLLRGWWGPVAMVRNVITLVRNGRGRRALGALPAPQHPAGVGDNAAKPERSILLRPALAGFLVPFMFVAVGFGVWNGIRVDEEETLPPTERCQLWDEGISTLSVVLVDCDDPHALGEPVTAATVDDCPEDTIAYATLIQREGVQCYTYRNSQG